MNVTFKISADPKSKEIFIDGVPFGTLRWHDYPEWNVAVNNDNKLIPSDVIYACVKLMEQVKEHIELKDSPLTIHIGFDDHVSGFLMTPDQYSHVYHLDDAEQASDFILESCTRTESNEADVFLDMTDLNTSYADLRTELDFYIQNKR